MKNTCKHLLITTALSGVLFASIAMADEASFSPVLEISNMSSKQRTIGEINYMQPIFGNDNNLVFADVKLKADTRKGKEANLGLVYRHNLNDAVVLGVYNYFDYRRTGNNFSVAGYTGGAEVLSKYVDARVNIYLPQNKKKKIAHNDKKSVDIIGTSLFATSGGHTYEQSYKGFDVEIGTPVFAFNDDLNDKIGTKVFVAKYDFTSKGAKKISGIRFRMEQPLGTLEMGNAGLHFMLNAETQYDNVRKRQYAAGISARFVFDDESKIGRRGKKAGLSSRMMDKVIRDVDIVTASNNAADIKDTFNDENGREIKNLYHVSGTKTTDGDGTQANPFSAAQLNRIDTNKALVVAVDATPELLARPDVVNGTEVTLHAGNTHNINLAVSNCGTKARITHNDAKLEVHTYNSIQHVDFQQVENIEHIKAKKSTLNKKEKTEQSTESLERLTVSSPSSTSVVASTDDMPGLETVDYVDEAVVNAKSLMLTELKQKFETVEADEEAPEATVPAPMRDANEEAAEAAALADFARFIRDAAGYVAGQVQGTISAVNTNINSGLTDLADATNQNYDIPEAPAPVVVEAPAHAAPEDYSDRMPAFGDLIGEGEVVSYRVLPKSSSLLEFEQKDRILTRTERLKAEAENLSNSDVERQEASGRLAAIQRELPTYVAAANAKAEVVASAPAQNPLLNIREGLEDSDRLFAEAQARRQARLDAQRDLVEKNQAATEIQSAFRGFQARKELALTPISEVRETVLGPQSEQVDATLYRAANALGQGLNQVAQSASQRFNQFFGAIGSYFTAPVPQDKGLQIDISNVVPVPTSAVEAARAPTPVVVEAPAAVLAPVAAPESPEIDPAAEAVKKARAATKIQAAFRGSRVREVVNKAKEIAVNIKLLDSLTKDAEALKEVAIEIAEGQKLKGDDAKNAAKVRKHLEDISKKTAVKKKEFKTELKEQYAKIEPKLSLMGVSEKRLGKVVAEFKLFKDQRRSYLEAMKEEAEARVVEKLDVYRISGENKDKLELRVEQARVALFKSLNSGKNIQGAQERLVVAIINTLPKNPKSPASKAFFRAVNPVEAVLSARKTRPEGAGAAGDNVTPRKISFGSAGIQETTE